MSILASGAFWIATAERAVKTAAQSAAVVLTTDITGILEVDPVAFFSVVALGAAYSVVTSLGSIPISGDGPSLVGEELPQRGKYADRDGTLDGKVTNAGE